MKKRSLKATVCAAILVLGLAITACGKVTLEDYVNSDEFQTELSDMKAQFEGQGMAIDIQASENTLTYLYTIEGAEANDEMKAAAEALNDQLDSSMKEVAAQLEEETKIDDIVVVVKWLAENGDELASREYTAE